MSLDDEIAYLTAWATLFNSTARVAPLGVEDDALLENDERDTGGES